MLLSDIEQFEHLGAWFNSTNGIAADINERTISAAKCFYAVNNVTKYNAVRQHAHVRV